MTKRTTHARGFTLIEIMVAVGLFAFVMTLATGAYLIMIGIGREARGIATGVNNLSTAVESMTRSIENGSGYCGGSGCTQSTFTFTDVSGNTVTYALSHSASECAGSTAGCITRAVGAGTAGPLTDPAVAVTTLSFTVQGQASGASDGQPHVTIVVAGSVQVSPGKTLPFNIETGATQHTIDL